PPLAAAPAPPPPVTAPAPPPPAITVPAPAPARPAPGAPVAPEQVYAARLLEYVNSIKRYPSSREARQLRPQGTVKLWLEIDRSGQLLESGVESSSGVLLLDQEALRTVRNGRYPAFPAQAFGDEPRHRFVVAMEYLRPGE
ncbi:MAG: TonB family protein, partial [Burkholderiales bacterium]|nr:TonB family protein [Burkholderiales bacterium]